MGLTNSLYTGLSGLSANSELISVAGNNIANVNTTAFKSNRLDFESQISQSLGNGSAPTSTSGGTNPSQIGLGVRLGSTSRDFNNGSLQITGVNTDMAIEGNGFFVLDINGNTRFTRAGNFKLDRDFNMVDSNGGKVQGYSVDSDFQVIPGVLGDLQVPLGTLTLAQATNTVNFAGNLNAGGRVASLGSVIATDTLYSDAAHTTQATSATLLTSLYPSASATALFATGDIVTITGATKGGASLPDHTFAVSATAVDGAEDHGTTVQDFMDFLRDVLGVDTSIGGGEGLAINSGQITVTGNNGTVNDLVINSSNIIKNKSTSPVQPFTMSKSQSADGESVRTTFVAYDSLGNELVIDLGIVLEDKGATGTSWRFYAQSESDSDLNRVLGNGTLTFDTNGQLVSATNDSFILNRVGTGATNPQQVTVAFTNNSGSLSALADTTSRVASLSQDGFPIGTLQSFAVDQDGTIVGTFSNSLVRNLGQVVISTFTNPQGLVEEGSNLYRESINSGSAALATPGSGGAGKVIGGALELSNVELSREFINLISASTGFSASSRVLTTSDRLIQELLATIR